MRMGRNKNNWKGGCQINKRRRPGVCGAETLEACVSGSGGGHKKFVRGWGGVGRDEMEYTHLYKHTHPLPSVLPPVQAALPAAMCFSFGLRGPGESGNAGSAAARARGQVTPPGDCV